MKKKTKLYWQFDHNFYRSHRHHHDYDDDLALYRKITAHCMIWFKMDRIKMPMNITVLYVYCVIWEITYFCCYFSAIIVIAVPPDIHYSVMKRRATIFHFMSNVKKMKWIRCHMINMHVDIAFRVKHSKFLYGFENMQLIRVSRIYHWTHLNFWTDQGWLKFVRRSGLYTWLIYMLSSMKKLDKIQVVHSRRFKQKSIEIHFNANRFAIFYWHIFLSVFVLFPRLLTFHFCSVSAIFTLRKCIYLLLLLGKMDFSAIKNNIYDTSKFYWFFLRVLFCYAEHGNTTLTLTILSLLLRTHIFLSNRIFYNDSHEIWMASIFLFSHTHRERERALIPVESFICFVVVAAGNSF